MEQLTSCYFCGDAVDAAVEEYPLVRSRTIPGVDTDRRIYLCPSCRRKLTDVIEHVLAAAFDDGASADAPGADDLRDVEMTATDVAVPGDDSDPPDAQAPEDEGSDHILGDPATDDVEPEAAPADDGVAAETASDDEVPGSVTDDTPSGSGSASEPESGEETNGPFETAVSDSHGANAETADEADEDGRDADGTDSAAETEDASAETDASGQTAGGSAGDTDEHDPQYTKAEFNKVVRLLQNREFPVEIDELVVVAGSAYEIDEPTCHAIIDALLQRGVVEDNGEELVRP